MIHQGIRKGNLVAVVLAMAFLAAFPVAAQELPVAAAPPSSVSDLSSPRATVGTFYEAMRAWHAGNDGRLKDALDCLYLEGVPASDRIEKGSELALELIEILDSVKGFDIESIPEDVEGPQCEVPLGEDGDLTLSLYRNKDGHWRFSYSKTLKKLDELKEAVTEEAEEKREVVAQFLPHLSSPRATMETFINGMNAWSDGGLEEALSTLDLSELDAQVREEVGQERAVMLKRIIDRYKYVRYVDLPDDPEGPQFGFLTNPAGSIVIAPVEVEEGGMKAWRFTAKSLDNLKSLYKIYRDRPVIVGITDSTPTLSSLWIWEQIEDHVPFLLHKTILLENYQWLGLFAIILVGMGLSRVIAYVLVVAIRKWFSREKLHLDQRLEKDFVRPIRIALMTWVWLLALTLLGLPPSVLTILRIGAKSATAVAAVWAIYRLADILGGYLGEKATKTETKFDDLLVPFVVRSLKVFVLLVGFVVVAETLRLDYKGLLTGLGLGGLAFALAARDTVSNIFGSLTILLDRPFHIGDWVRIGDIDGSVESVGMRSTRVRTFYNSLITVPNGELITATVDNMGARRYRRIKTTISITYDTPPEKIEAFSEGIRELIRKHPYTRKDYFHVYFNEFTAHSLDLLLYCFVETPDWSTELRERHRLFVDIVRLAKGLGVEFAFPTQTLYVRQEESAGAQPSPSGADEAFVLGRAEADRIIEETLGKNAPVPPPVTFDSPSGDGEQIPIGDVDQDS
jgi:MscS family membrane protein